MNKEEMKVKEDELYELAHKIVGVCDGLPIVDFWGAIYITVCLLAKNHPEIHKQEWLDMIERVKTTFDKVIK